MNKMKLPSPIPTLENVFVKPKSQIYSWKIRYEHKNRRSLFVRLKTVAGYSARVYQISIFTVRILAEKIPGRQRTGLALRRLGPQRKKTYKHPLLGI